MLISDQIECFRKKNLKNALIAFYRMKCNKEIEKIIARSLVT